MTMRTKMSEYDIPFHIQEEIMKRLPVKSLVQFRSVSKQWKSLIDSSEFIAAHCLHRHTQPQHLLVSYVGPNEVVKCVSYIDDDTFPKQRSLPTLPPSLKELWFQNVVGSSCGLLCFSGSDPDVNTAVIWNPLIRKSAVVPFLVKRISAFATMSRRPYIGFGVCPVTSDPKIVSIGQYINLEPEPSYQCEVFVYTLSSGNWRRLFTKLPTTPFLDYRSQAVVDGFIYWRAGFPNHNMIISFDVTNESFEMIDLPDSLAAHDHSKWHMSMLRESLAIVQSGINISTVWKMEDGVQRSFVKLFTITTMHDDIVGFIKIGIPIMQVTDDDEESIPELVVYDPNSEHNNVLNIIEDSETYPDFHIYSYMETLLLLDQPGCSSY